MFLSFLKKILDIRTLKLLYFSNRICLFVLLFHPLLLLYCICVRIQVLSAARQRLRSYGLLAPGYVNPMPKSHETSTNASTFKSSNSGTGGSNSSTADAHTTTSAKADAVPPKHAEVQSLIPFSIVRMWAFAIPT